MRLLPFDDDDISIACGNLIYLNLKAVNLSNRPEQIKVFTELFGTGSIISFSIEEGNSANGFTSNENIINSFDQEFSNIIQDNLKDIVADSKEIFRVIYNPKLMFDFIKFKTFLHEK